MSEDEDEWRENNHAVAKAFNELFKDPMFCDHIAPKVTCAEANTIAVTVAMLHGDWRTWLDAHMASDEDGDEHHIPDAPDHLPDDWSAQ